MPKFLIFMYILGSIFSFGGLIGCAVADYHNQIIIGVFSGLAFMIGVAIILCAHVILFTKDS